METERNNVTRKRTDRTSQAWAGPRHSEGIIGNRLAALRGDPGYHRQAQRGRHEHRAAPTGKPAAASGLQGQASLIGKIEEQERWVERPPTKHDEINICAMCKKCLCHSCFYWLRDRRRSTLHRSSQTNANGQPACKYRGVFRPSE